MRHISIFILWYLVCTAALNSIALGKLRCRSNLSGGNYVGGISVTASGRRCQRWDAQTPHPHSITSHQLPDVNLAAAENYCRSPDFDPSGPWCFTTDPAVKWEYCNVPVCENEGCRDTQKGIHYIATGNKTVSGTPCREWSDIVVLSAYGYIKYAKTSFPDGNLEHAYCRNPLGIRERPWCHVMSGDEEENAWEYCQVPLCDKLNEVTLSSVLENKACELHNGNCVSRNCCPRNDYVSNLCAQDDMVCCLTEGNCNWEKELTASSQWPHGSYALPMSIFGCPRNDHFDWQRGQVSLKSTTGPLIGNLTTDTKLLHLLGPYSEEEVTLNLCLRDDAFSGRSIDWPKGSYCMLKFKDSCPKGFRESALIIEGAANVFDVSYDVNVACDVTTGVFCFNFCCREDGEANRLITLPTEQPFYLLQNQRECPTIKGMQTTKENIHINMAPGQFIQLDGEEEAPPAVTLLDGGLSLGMCYYETTDSRTCYDPVDNGFFYRGHTNVTALGVCTNWKDIEKIDHRKLYHYVGLDDNNFCRNTLVFEFEQQPWCFVKGEKVLCDIQQCESPWSSYKEIGIARPARQAIGGNQQAQLANDGDLATCSRQRLTEAWWQMDLQGWYDVMGIRLYRIGVSVEACVVRMVNLYIGRKPDDFRTSGALMCARNVSLGASQDGVVQCVQPTRGRFITLENLAFIEYETIKETYERCLDVCEVVAYVRDSNCGRLLLERTLGREIQPTISTSSGYITEERKYILQNLEILCLETTKLQDQWVKVDLLYPRRLQGVVTQGSVNEVSMVTAFAISYGLTQQNMVPYEDFPGTQKLFRNSPDDRAPQQHEFLTEITARLVLLTVKGFVDKPCLRLDLLGCINIYTNLAKSGSSSQSSQWGEKSADLASDLDTKTCSETLIENATWWRVSLPEVDNVLHTVVLKSGNVFPWNLAVRRPASQISTGWGGLASFTVDGRQDTNYWDASCSTTVLHDYPWWAVDMGIERTITTVKVTNRLDCCEARLNKFRVVVGDIQPIEGTPLNTSLYNVCAEHDSYFGAGWTTTLQCQAPVRGRYLVVMITIKSEYLTLCEVMAFGDRAPFLVGVTSVAPPGGVDEDSRCHLVADVPVGGLVHSYSCPARQMGNSLVAEVSSSGAMSICDVVAYGGSKAAVTIINQGSRMAEVSCVGTELLHIELLTSNLTTVTPEQLLVSKQNLRTIFHLCEGVQSCSFPVLEEGDRSGDAQRLSFFCSRVTQPSDVCGAVILKEGLIMTPNFPFYYGLDLECRWVIQAPVHRYVAVNVTSVMLPGKVETYRDGCREVDLGECIDIATIYYTSAPKSYVTNTAGGEVSMGPIGLNITNPGLYISDTSLVTLTFKSCYRNVGLNGEWLQRLGLKADITFQGCQGCQVQSSDMLLVCSGQCGQITSRGFPHSYAPSDRTQWTITVEAGNYVSLEFEDFDVYESPLALTCQKDYVEVLDVNLVGGRTSIGRYCNSDRPPKVLQSSWSQLELLFISDAEISGRGFHAVYHQNKYQLADDFPAYGPSLGCPTNWTRFEAGCYSLYTWYKPLIWSEAEAECRRWEGHLVAINSQLEMIFLHYSLTTKWRTPFYRTFIGLNDRETEGRWQWSDGSPVTYTDWSQSSNYEGLSQPDGAAVEDCAMIRLDSMHDTRSWHDIPCAYDKVQQFLCEKSYQDVTDVSDLETSASTQDNSYDKLLFLPEGEQTSGMGVSRCENGELIISYLRCDGSTDCHDGSDEIGCQEEISTCSEDHFRCVDETCVSLTNFCDFKSDCPDGSDEASCVKRPCNSTEFRCDNGECIPASYRCNLLTDCHDGSDEQECDRCALEVAFQCFDSSCIPRAKRCDGVVDCPGALHEDEGADCSTETAESSCLGWKVAGYEESGRYRIQPPGVEGFDVDCDMTSEDEYVITTLHHDAESRIYVTGYHNPGDYERPIDYGLTREQLKAVTSSSVRCEQYVSIECDAANGMVFDDYWRNVDGEARSWLMPTDDCNCILNSSCDGENKDCMCATAQTMLPRIVTGDSGMLDSLPDLPMTAISLSGTGFAGSQTQYHYVGPLVCYQYANQSRDDFRCMTGQWVPRYEQCVADRNQYGDTTGCRDMSHLMDCRNISCPPEYVKCAEGHCVPLERVCDGTSDCIGSEDEQNCDNFTCSGHLRCKGEEVCVTMAQRCDGIEQCQTGNDEWLCDITCPDECTCVGLVFKCPHTRLSTIPDQISHKVRKLDFTGNSLFLQNETFRKYLSLGELILQANGIVELPVGVFSSLNNLYYLDLSNNSFEVIRSFTFQGLFNLKVLNLEHNTNLLKIESFAFSGLIGIEQLEMKGLGLQTLEADAFEGMAVLLSLDISKNAIKTFENVLRGLDVLTQLNISENPGLEITRQEFANVPNLQSLQSDHFKYCCFVNDRVLEENCLPKRDEFSSCEDLMRRDVLKVFLWVLGLMAFVCNAFVLIYRHREKMTVYSFSVMNLAVSDFFMGVYMVSLASVDTFYRGVYIEFADDWTGSWMCQFLGFINTLSSETSVFTLCLISADRFYKVVFPLQASNFNMHKAKIVMGCIWLLGIFLAALPLMPIPYFGDGFYGKSSVCISIYLTQDYSAGWQFSIAVFHALNFTCFMFIFVAYTYLFNVIKESNSKTKSMTQGQKPNQNDIALARRLTLVVFTDFLCWVPINLMGVAAGAGVNVPGEVYAWVVVFLLPINSALNPVLYTISSIRVKMKQAEEKPSQLMQSCLTVAVYTPNTKEKAKNLKAFLATYTTVHLSMSYDITKKLAAILVEVHAKGYYCLNMELPNIIVRGNEDNFDLGLDVALNTGADPSENIHALGKLTSVLLRRYVSARK